MTKADKPTRRETYSTVRVRYESRPLIIEIHATWVSIRAKGCRTAYQVTMDQIYNLGAKNAAAAARAARDEDRKARKNGGKQA